MTRAIGYARVSTERQGESGLGLDSQRRTIEAACEQRGWEHLETYVDVASGKSTDRRPHLRDARRLLAIGGAEVLVVAKLDRLSRSLVDFAGLMADAKREGWGIVALDIGVDTSTVNGELVANIIMSLAQWERQLIAARVKAALDETRERGTVLGRRPNVSAETLAMIVAMRADDQSFRVIADALNSARVPTAQGGKAWHASTVRHLYLGAVEDTTEGSTS
jgi:DNA invertase Pin-like site-specific DNA recombinase